jgi:hypothetical protein
MTTSSLRNPSLLAFPFVLFVSACAPATDADANDEDTASSEAAASSSCIGVSAKDFTHYNPTGANVGRELEQSLTATFVQSHSAKIPGVVRARYSSSPYDFAATFDLRGWSIVSSGNFDGSGSELFVRISGSKTDPNKRNFKASKAIFDAMTNATESTSSGVTRRTSSHGSVTCERYGAAGDSYQCGLGPVQTVSPLEGSCF